MTATTLPPDRPGHLTGAVARYGPVPRCARDRMVLDGGPVAYWCPACRHGVMAADIGTDYHRPARSQTAATDGGGPP
jgi:hypothetical protein